MGRDYVTVTSFLCQFWRVFVVYTLRVNEESNTSIYSVPAIVLTKSQLDISSSYPLVPELQPCNYRLLRAYPSGCCDTKTTDVTLRTAQDDKLPLYSPLCVKRALPAGWSKPPSSHSSELRKVRYLPTDMRVRTTAKRLRPGYSGSCDWLLHILKGGTNGLSCHSGGSVRPINIVPEANCFHQTLRRRCVVYATTINNPFQNSTMRLLVEQ